MIKELTQDLVETVTEKEASIVLFNDEVNTFDWVIEALMEVCDHTSEQAEQCAMIVHHKGKYAVKSGSREELLPRCTALGDRGLMAEIQ